MKDGQHSLLGIRSHAVVQPLNIDNVDTKIFGLDNFGRKFIEVCQGCDEMGGILGD